MEHHFERIWCFPIKNKISAGKIRIMRPDGFNVRIGQ